MTFTYGSATHIIMTKRDIFEPVFEPALTFYKAFVKESEKREKTGWPKWVGKENEAVYETACKWAHRNGLNEPTFEDVENASEIETF